MQQIGLYEALSRMNEMSKDNIPFDITFYSCDLSKQKSAGLLSYSNVVLRTGLSASKGIKSRSLIGFTDLDNNKHKWFYLPLLQSFNNYNIKHGRH